MAGEKISRQSLKGSKFSTELYSLVGFGSFWAEDVMGSISRLEFFRNERRFEPEVKPARCRPLILTRLAA